MSLKLPFGIKDETLVHISEAQQGLACACLCPGCKAPLVARKGSVMVHHFAHHKVAECAKAVETALHLASKQILTEHRKIALPEVQLQFASYRAPIPVSGVRTFPLDQVSAECRTGDVVPDILAYSDGVPLMIEIRVTHEVDETKRAKISRLGISAVEIDLSSFSRNFSPAELLDAVVHQTTNKKWVFNAKVERLRKQFLDTGEPKRLVSRGLAYHVDHCPINSRPWKGNSYANVIDDCAYCPFSLEVDPSKDEIVCGGRHKIATVDELRAYDNRTRQDINSTLVASEVSLSCVGKRG